MEHGSSLIELVVVASTALVLGIVLQSLRQPAIVGYIFAGVLLGPSAFGLIRNREMVAELAELGVLLLLFVIGLELSLRAFRRVYRVAILCALFQIGVSLGGIALLGLLFDWTPLLIVIGGFALALSSTAVAIKLLDDIGELRTDVGRIAVGVLIAQDLAVVPMLLVIAGLAGEGGFTVVALLKLLVAVGLLIAMIAYLTRRERVAMPFVGLLEANVELTALTALAFCFGAALASTLFGLSPAYGAFLAGLWLGNSNARTSVLGAVLPIQGVLLMVFFLSIGLLLDLDYVIANWAQVLILLVAVTLLKTGLNVGILRMLGEPWPRAWLAGVVLGQIGEFSFVLVAAGAAVYAVDWEAQRLINTVIALSLMTSPFWLFTARRMGQARWRRILTWRDFMRQIYGKETEAVVGASSRALATTRQFTVTVGHAGAELLHRQRRPEESSDADVVDPPPAADDVDFFDVEVEPGGPARRRDKDDTD
ncbi:MAG: cation:proton antiporter [Alphaproteobacteria bacterium]